MEYAQNTCGFGLMAVSLGYFDTLLSMSGSTTSSELNESEKASAGELCMYMPRPFHSKPKQTVTQISRDTAL